MGKTYKDQHTHWSKKRRPRKKAKNKGGHPSHSNAEKTVYNKWGKGNDGGENFEKFSRKR